MSDPKPAADPVDQRRSVDDGVGSAHEGLAEAEVAAHRADPASAQSADAVAARPAADDVSSTVDAHADASAARPADVEAAPAPVTRTIVEEPNTAEYAPPGGVWTPSEARDEPAVTSSEPVRDTVVYPPEDQTLAYTAAPVAPAPQPQPIFVQAPEAPHPRGNRGAAGAIGLVAALAFGVLYLAVWLGLSAVNGDVDGGNLVPTLLSALASWQLWVPVVVFFIAFWLLGAIINRGRWGVWVIFGLLVGLAAWAGHILGALFQAPFWLLTAREGAQLVEGQVLAPLAIAAFLLGRELTIWFGAWVASRGRRVTELNLEAQREYERTLEAGPQLVRA